MADTQTADPIAERLKALEGKIDEAELAQSGGKNELEKLEAERKRLEDLQKKLSTAVANYVKAYDDLVDRRASLKTWNAQHEPTFAKLAAAHKTGNDEIVKREVDRVLGVIAARKDAEKKLKDAEDAKPAADQEVKDTLRVFETWINLPKVLATELSELDDEKLAIEEDITAGRPALAYYRYFETNPGTTQEPQHRDALPFAIRLHALDNDTGSNGPPSLVRKRLLAGLIISAANKVTDAINAQRNAIKAIADAEAKLDDAQKKEQAARKGLADAIESAIGAPTPT